MSNVYGGAINTGQFVYGRRTKGTFRAVVRYAETTSEGVVCAIGAAGIPGGPRVGPRVEFVNHWTELPSNTWLEMLPGVVYQEVEGTGRWETGDWKNYREVGSNDEIHQMSYRYAVRVFGGTLTEPRHFIMFSPAMPADWYTLEPGFWQYEGWDVAVSPGSLTELEWDVDIIQGLGVDRVLEIIETDSVTETHPPGCTPDGVRTLSARETAITNGYRLFACQGKPVPEWFDIDIKGFRAMTGNVPKIFKDREVSIVPPSVYWDDNIFPFVIFVNEAPEHRYGYLGGMRKLVEAAQVGSSGALFNIPLSVDETFQIDIGETANYRVQIDGSLISLSVDHAPHIFPDGTGESYRLYIDYLVFPSTVRYVGDFKYMDGTTPNVTPVFTDANEENSWEGTTSDVISYYGIGVVEAYYRGYLASWQIRGGTIQSLGVKLQNPEALDLPADDIRAQILYTPPTGKSRIRTTSRLRLPKEFTIVDWTNETEAGEWVGVDCDVEITSAGLRVTAYSNDAYIYRGYPQPPFDPENYQLRHAPPYRFWQLVVDCDDELKSDLTIVHGLEQAPERRSFKALYAAQDWNDYPMFDTCAPEGSNIEYDNGQSYFITSPALWLINSNDPLYQEKTNTTICWGIGRLTWLHIVGLRAGKTYLFKQIKGKAFSAHFVVQKGYNDWHEAGAYPGEEDEHRLVDYRGPMLIVDGRVGYECVLTEKHITEMVTFWSNTVLPSTLSPFQYNAAGGSTGLARYPWDDFGTLSHEVLIPYNSSWEHEDTTEEPWHFNGDDVLYCWEKVLTWFVVSEASYNTPPSGNFFTYDVKTVPMFDYWAPCYHLANDIESPTPYLTVPYIFWCRGRAFGIVQPEGLPPVEAHARDKSPQPYERLTITDAGTDVESPEELQTNRFGFYASSQHTTKSTTIKWQRANMEMPLEPKSRMWYRLVLRKAISMLTEPWFRMRHGKATKPMPEGFKMTDATGEE